MPSTPPSAAIFLSPRERAVWRTLQTALWLAGVALVATLLWAPQVGLHALWNVLIPAAPALLVFAPGLWRNICPLATTALLPRHLRSSARHRLSPALNARLHLWAVLGLLLLVPARHLILDTSGLASALALLWLAAMASALGSSYEWKSAWCSGLCPIHPVESLYGVRPAWTPRNAHCHSCAHCVQPCPDATPGHHLDLSPEHPAHGWRHRLMVGGFAGFIFGWFLVPDYQAHEGWLHLPTIYGWPLLGMAVSLALYHLAERRIHSRASHRRLDRFFAAAAVSIYYSFRVPALFGVGPHPGDGMLLDLSQSLPPILPWIWAPMVSALFLWWMVFRKSTKPKRWLQRPPMDRLPHEPSPTRPA